MKPWIDTALQLLSKSLFPVAVELNELDWKANISDNGNRLAEQICAFANYPGGGYLAFGINNEGQNIFLSKKEMDDIIQKMGNIARNNLAQPVGIDHEVAMFNGSPVLFVYIPESGEKPVHLRGKGLYDGFKRSAGQTVRLTQKEVRYLVGAPLGFNFESMIAAKQLSDDEIFEMLNWESYFSLIGLRSPDTKQVIIEALANENLIRQSALGWDITNLGAILFAKDLKRFNELRRKIPRIIIYKDGGRVNAIKEHEISKGYACGFEEMVKYIMDQLPTHEVIETAVRKQVSVYPEKAIREFLANALIHQDLVDSSTYVFFEIFKDRIEVTNPGAPLVDTNRFIDTVPKSRNETLASLMRRFNLCEERGSGVDRAVEVIEDYLLPAPKFIKGDGYTKVILYATVPLTKMSVEDRIRACYQHTCLHYVHNQIVNNQSVRKRFNIEKNNAAVASRIINETIDAGLIKSYENDNVSKKFAFYIPYWA